MGIINKINETFLIHGTISKVSSRVKAKTKQIPRPYQFITPSQSNPCIMFQPATPPIPYMCIDSPQTQLPRDTHTHLHRPLQSDLQPASRIDAILEGGLLRAPFASRLVRCSVLSRFTPNFPSQFPSHLQFNSIQFPTRLDFCRCIVPISGLWSVDHLGQFHL